MTNIEKQLPSPKDYEHGFVYIVVQLKDDTSIYPKSTPDDTVKTIEYHYININQKRWGFLHSKTC
jgi:hypothetical protein